MADKKISQLTAASTPLAGTEVLPIVQSGSTVKVASDDLTVKNVRSNATTGILQIAGPAAASTRVMTTPDANFSAARIDAAQTFIGSNTFSSPGGFVATFKSDAAVDFRPVGFTNNANTYLGAVGIDHTAPYFALKAYGTDLFFGAGADGLKEARLTSAGNFSLANGNFVVGTAAKGIDFSANTGAAGETSSLLDWYEEGLFVPTMTASTSGTVTLAYTTLAYTRVGRLVTVTGEITVDSVASPVGDISIGNLPFANSGLSQRASRTAFLVEAGSFTGAPTGVVQGFIDSNSSTVNIRLVDDFAYSSPASNLQAGTFFRFCFSYMTA